MVKHIHFTQPAPAPISWADGLWKAFEHRAVLRILRGLGRETPGKVPIIGSVYGENSDGCTASQDWLRLQFHTQSWTLASICLQGFCGRQDSFV